MVMEFLDGITMTPDKFEAMEKSDQQVILQRLSEQIQLLRSVEPEGGGYYGRIDYQGWSRLTTFLRSMDPGFRGPYDTNDDFLSALLDSFEFHAATASFEPDYFPNKLKHYTEMKRVLGSSKECKPTLTHFDIEWMNIIVWPIEKIANCQGNDWRVAILDWDHTG